MILVDPDNGLEVKTSRPGNFHKFIRYSEARDLFERMGRNSVLVVYQHLPRVRREEYLEGLHARIREELRCPDPVGIADSQIALVMIEKDQAGRRRLQRAVRRYLRRDLLVKGI